MCVLADPGGHPRGTAAYCSTALATSGEGMAAAVASVNRAIGLAAEAAEKIRELNLVTHPSSGWSGLDDPVDVYEVLGALSALADRLQQTTNQLGRFLEYRLHGGELTVAFGTYAEDPPAAVTAAAHALNQARALSAELAQLISDAQAAVVAISPPPITPEDPSQPDGSPLKVASQATTSPRTDPLSPDPVPAPSRAAETPRRAQSRTAHGDGGSETAIS